MQFKELNPSGKSIFIGKSANTSSVVIVLITNLIRLLSLSNLITFELIKQGNITDFENATEVFDFSIFHSNKETSRLEIVVVIRRTGSRDWFNTRFTKFATWARPYEEITIIYDHKTGSTDTPELNFEKNTKKMFIKPVVNIAIDYDIYVCKFTF